MSDIGPETPDEQRPEHKTASADDLELLAIEEQFTEAYHAGLGPRLSAYLRRYPQYADELTAFVSAFLPEAALEARDATHEAPMSPLPSPGVQRALDAILAVLDLQPRAHEVSLVAEERAPYATVPVGLGALAQAHGLSLEKLAVYIDLSLEALAEVDRMALAPKDLPPVLTQRIAEALDIREEGVTWAAAQVGGEGVAEDGTPSRASQIYAVLTTHPSLSPEQRLRWQTLLDGDKRR